MSITSATPATFPPSSSGLWRIPDFPEQCVGKDGL